MQNLFGAVSLHMTFYESITFACRKRMTFCYDPHYAKIVPKFWRILSVFCGKGLGDFGSSPVIGFSEKKSKGVEKR